jgi:hypothetical protein
MIPATTAPQFRKQEVTQTPPENLVSISKHFPVLSSFMIYYRICGYANATGTTSGSGTVYPSGAPEFKILFKKENNMI